MISSVKMHYSFLILFTHLQNILCLSKMLPLLTLMTVFLNNLIPCICLFLYIMQYFSSFVKHSISNMLVSPRPFSFQHFTNHPFYITPTTLINPHNRGSLKWTVSCKPTNSCSYYTNHEICPQYSAIYLGSK